MKCSSLSSVLIFAAALTTAAHASITPVGAPQPHGSWAQGFNESGVNFDHIQMFMESGPLFDSPTAITAFSNGSWGQTFNNGAIVVADGNTVNNLDFTVIFSGNQSDAFTFCFQAYDGNTLVDNATANWTGGGWNIYGGSDCPDQRIVPTPGSMALLGLGGLFVRRRRR